MKTNPILWLIAAMLWTTHAWANPGVPHTFANGQVADADQVNTNFSTVYAIVPIGSVIPWHKSIDNSLTLPNQWVECNGQVLDDPDSPLNGVVIPDLNGATGTYGNKGLFVRGGTTSGEFQDDQIISHKHNDSGHSHTVKGERGVPEGGGAGYGLAGSHFINPSNTHNASANLGDAVSYNGSTVRTGDETHPKNMSMVWIMRVK